jgi:hypothetical protein
MYEARDGVDEQDRHVEHARSHQPFTDVSLIFATGTALRSRGVMNIRTNPKTAMLVFLTITLIGLSKSAEAQECTLIVDARPAQPSKSKGSVTLDIPQPLLSRSCWL